MNINFNAMCRLCMGKTEYMLPLFEEGSSFLTRIGVLAPKIKMSSDDGLPSKICQHCSHQLDCSYNFKLQCENSDITLHRYLTERKLNVNSDQVIAAEKCDLVAVDRGEHLNVIPANIEFKGMNEDGSAVEDATEKIQSHVSLICRDKRLVSQNLDLIDHTNDLVKDEQVYDDVVDHIEQTKSNSGKKYTCQFCGKQFPQKSNLLTHTRTHTGEKPFPCNLCGKCFSRRSTLQDHVKTHTGEKPYLCEECGKHFARSSHLKVHLKVHSGERPFSCGKCGKSFVHGCHLKDHLSTHSGDKPFCCAECGKCFSSSSIFKRHFMRHSGDKPFTCNKCGKRFNGSSDLYIHTRTHTGDKRYPCVQCGKRFLLGCHLKDHMKIHSGEKPFSCVECGKCFSRKQVLNKHRKSHR